MKVTTLCDTGADVQLLVSYPVAVKAKSLGARVETLKRPIQLLDWKNENQSAVTLTLTANFEVDGRRFLDQEFLVTDTGYDVFIGQEWLAKQDVWLHPRTRKFAWPEDLPATARFSPAITVNPTTRKIDKKAQADAERRDRAIRQRDKADSKSQQIRSILKRRELPSLPPGTAASNQNCTFGEGMTKPAETSKPEPLEDLHRIAAITKALADDPRRDRWNRLPTPTEPIEFETVDQAPPPVAAATTRSCRSGGEEDVKRVRWVDQDLKATAAVRSCTSGGVKGSPSWKTYQDERIDFPKGEDPEHIRLVRETLPDRLKHLEGFFSKKNSTTLPPSHPGRDVVLELERPLQGSPPRYRTPLQFMPLEKQTTDELLAIGFIEPCMAEKPASNLFVPKPHSTERRFCQDYRWVNKFLKPRLVPAPDVPGTLNNCKDAKHFTKLDIIRAFNRLRMAVGSEYLTAFRTRQGVFQWRVLPFGLKVGPGWWQNFVNAQLNELLDLFASAYADDVLVFTEEDDDEVHWVQVEEVIHRLHRAQLQGDIKKSRFNVTTIDYLGLVIEAGQGVRIDPRKIQAIQDWKFDDLTNRSAVRSFLGLINFVRLFCHHESEVAEPLNRLLKKEVPFVRGEEQRQAFEKLKQLATEAPVLSFFVPGRPTRVETDASRNATGGVIWQEQDDGEWRPVGYFSKTMTPTERAYPIQDRELLAVVQTLEHYEPELLGTKFFVVTDHQALLYWSSKRLLSTRQVRWADFLANFDITFQYRRGKDNVVADALSRKTVEAPTVKAREKEERTMTLIPPTAVESDESEDLDPRDYQPGHRCSSGGVNCPKVNALSQEEPRGADLVDLIATENESQQAGSHNGKIVVPSTTGDGKTHLRTALIREAHEPTIFAHGGQNKTLRLLQRDYYWRGMNQDVRRYVKNCAECCRNKSKHDKTPGLLHPLPVPNRVWEQVVVDGKDMPEDDYGYNYVWVFVCKFSRIKATLPGKKTDTAEIIAQRYYRYLYRLLGCPEAWLTDNAGPFVSEFLSTLNKLTGTKHRHGSAMHPQTQGAVEITNAELDQQLRFYVDKYQRQWSVHLPALDFAHNAAWHSSLGMAPLKVALGAEPRNPLSAPLPTVIIDEDHDRQTLALQLVEQAREVQELARSKALAAQKAQEKQANKSRRPVDFVTGDKVYVRKKGFTTAAPTTRLDSQYAGPWKILEVKGHSYVLDVPPYFKGSNLFHADRLRKAPDNPLPQQVEEPEEPEEIDGEPEWEVEKILASRLKGKAKRLEYQVKWKGLDPDEDWYPARNFKNAPVEIEKFHEKYPETPGPPVNLQDWIRAAAQDISATDQDDDDVAQRGGKKKRRPTRHN
jgi:hypothetical protein